MMEAPSESSLNQGRRTYVVVSPPGNTIGHDVVRQLLMPQLLPSQSSPASVHIIFVCAYKQQDDETTSTAKLQAVCDELLITSKTEAKHSSVQIVPFPFLNKSIADCKQLTKEVALKIQKHLHPKENPIEHDKPQPSSIDGIFFNFHGAGVKDPCQAATTATNMLELAEWKVLGLALLMNELLIEGSSVSLSTSCRFIVAGSEAARGVPQFGFQSPSFDSSSSMEHWLCREPEKSALSCTWQTLYGHLHGIVGLYLGALASNYPEYYFGAVSPGLTPESFDATNTPNPSIMLKMSMAISRTGFAVWKYSGIGHDLAVGAGFVVHALTNTADENAAGDNTSPDEAKHDAAKNWPYSSGSLVGSCGVAKSDLKDQSTMDGGQYLNDARLQMLAYQTLQGICLEDDSAATS